MNSKFHKDGDSKDIENSNALTEAGDWNQYYSERNFEEMENRARGSTIIDDYLKNRSGSIFELGCGGSRILARSAMLGWEVGGIDFNYGALELIRVYLAKNNSDTTNVVFGDIFSYDNSSLGNKYDILCSFGFLEHFNDPQSIINKWKSILKPNGMVISYIPNLSSINAKFFKKYDYEFWAQHINYSPHDMDQFHINSGLVPLKRAQYCGKYDTHMLIPWEKIQQLMNNKYFFKLIKYVAYYGIGTLLGLLPKSNVRIFNSYVAGVYTLPAQSNEMGS